MVCLHPRAVTFSRVRSMNHLLSSHHSECLTHAASLPSQSQPPLTSLSHAGCTCMAFARLGGEFCQAQHLLLIVDKWTGGHREAQSLPFTHTGQWHKGKQSKINRFYFATVKEMQGAELWILNDLRKMMNRQPSSVFNPLNLYLKPKLIRRKILSVIQSLWGLKL